MTEDQTTARPARDTGSTQIAKDGDRRVAVTLFSFAVLGLLILSAPVQSWLQSRERVAALESELATLEERNEQLQARVEDLNDPDMLELEARRRHGYARDGETAFLIEGLDEAPDATELRTDTIQDDAVWIVRALRAWQGDEPPSDA